MHVQHVHPHRAKLICRARSLILSVVCEPHPLTLQTRNSFFEGFFLEPALGMQLLSNRTFGQSIQCVSISCRGYYPLELPWKECREHARVCRVLVT